MSTCFYGINANDSDILYKVCPNSLDNIMISNSTSASVFDTYATGVDMDFLWILIAGSLVFFMQTGFTLLEAGMVKHTNVQNILFKNMMDACIGTICWFVFGYCVAYGDDDKSGGFIGVANPVLLSQDYNSFFFQWAFAATAATIVSGSVAERCRLDAYFVYTVCLALWVYPIVVHWMWSNTGWLSPFNENISAIKGGVIDFAGSGVVHMVGGWSGLCGAYFLGPRYLRFDQSGQKSPTLDRQFTFGHNVPFQVLGTFILWFGWYGFNCGSTLAANGAMELASKVAVNTTLAAAGGGLTVAAIGRFTGGIWMIPGICNGVLGGLVAVTAPCCCIKPWAAILVGITGGIFYWCSSNLIEKVLKIDDPLDAFSVHGVCGMWGVINVGIFAYDPDDIAFAGYSDDVVNLSQGYRFGIQLMAAIVIAAWTLAMGCIMFGTLKFLKRLRIPEEEEKKGLDLIEHGGKGYSMAKTYSTQSKHVMSKEQIAALRNARD